MAACVCLDTLPHTISKFFPFPFFLFPLFVRILFVVCRLSAPEKGHGKFDTDSRRDISIRSGQEVPFIGGQNGGYLSIFSSMFHVYIDRWALNNVLKCRFWKLSYPIVYDYVCLSR